LPKRLGGLRVGLVEVEEEKEEYKSLNSFLIIEASNPPFSQ
jgi:hypothetical protein